MLENPRLLITLAACAAGTGGGLKVPGTDLVESHFFVAVARDRGFVEPSGTRLTAKGWTWTRRELAKLAPLFAGADLEVAL